MKLRKSSSNSLYLSSENLVWEFIVVFSIIAGLVFLLIQLIDRFAGPDLHELFLFISFTALVTSVLIYFRFRSSVIGLIQKKESNKRLALIFEVHQTGEEYFISIPENILISIVTDALAQYFAKEEVHLNWNIELKQGDKYIKLPSNKAFSQINIKDNDRIRIRGKANVVASDGDNNS